jgi:hypothetical protein
MQYQVKDLDIDLYNFKTNFNFDKVDIQIVAEFINSRQFSILARRLDKNEGWNDNIQALAWFTNKDIIQIYTIGSSESREKQIIIDIEFDIEASSETIHKLSYYQLADCPPGIQLNRPDFNREFNTNIVTLPSNIYAVGLKDGKMYMYNEGYSEYFMIYSCIEHIIRVALTYRNYHFYFLVCCHDGYMEGHYDTVRTIPKQIGEYEYSGQRSVKMTEPHEYPVFHKHKYVMAHSSHNNTSFTIDIPDRHYFYHNLYNPFRSFHRGVSFHKKINKIVFGGQDRGGKHNFTKRRDIEISQRDYFKSDLVPKDNIVCSGWIDRSEMINYKYILDIDGNSSTWDATAWKLNSRSVILKTQSSWKQWFYAEYLPNVHYLEINDDFSNLQEVFKWCESHQDECLQMIENCKQLFQKTYQYTNVIQDTLRIIDDYNLHLNA